MSKGKVFRSKNRNFAIAFWISDCWYEEIHGVRCYQHASITSRLQDGYYICSVVLLFFKLSLFVAKTVDT